MKFTKLLRIQLTIKIKQIFLAAIMKKIEFKKKCRYEIIFMHRLYCCMQMFAQKMVKN